MPNDTVATKDTDTVSAWDVVQFWAIPIVACVVSCAIGFASGWFAHGR